MLRIVIAVLTGLSLVACATVAQRQAALVSDYIARHPDLGPELRQALLDGVVVSGMTAEEALLSSGVRANGNRGYSIWVVGQDGELYPPPIVIPPGTPVAFCFANRTQFRSAGTQSFVVYLDGEGTVSRVQRAYCQNQ